MFSKYNSQVQIHLFYPVCNYCRNFAFPVQLSVIQLPKTIT